MFTNYENTLSLFSGLLDSVPLWSRDSDGTHFHLLFRLQQMDRGGSQRTIRRQKARQGCYPGGLSFPILLDGVFKFLDIPGLPDHTDHIPLLELVVGRELHIRTMAVLDGDDVQVVFAAGICFTDGETDQTVGGLYPSDLHIPPPA